MRNYKSSPIAWLLKPMSKKSLRGIAAIMISSSPLLLGLSVAGRPDAYSEGLAAWRKEGFTDRAACASCHGPDGLELAVYAFDDATIRRRAAIHVTPEDADTIVGFIHSVRDRYGIKKLRDPIADRPFQPGGSVLPGETTAERDDALAVELESVTPTLTHGRISSTAEALKAKDEVLNIDLWQLRVGILFNRLSEDAFHGAEHATVATWLPDVPRSMNDAERKSWFDIEDRYLADPSEENLWAMLDAVEKTTHARSESAASSLAYEKLRSLLIGQHLMRKELLGTASKPMPAEIFAYRKKRLIDDPMWEIGNFARNNDGYSRLEDLGFPESVVAKKTGGPSGDQQLKDLRLPWLWLGWMADQGLQHITTDRRLATGQYMCDALWGDGPYPVHNAFFLTKKLITQSYVPEAWASSHPQHFVLDYSGLLRNGKHTELEPKAHDARERYRRFVSNCFLMSMYLQIDQMKRTHEVWIRDSIRGNFISMAAFIDRADPSHKSQTKALMDEGLALIADSTQRIP